MQSRRVFLKALSGLALYPAARYTWDVLGSGLPHASVQAKNAELSTRTQRLNTVTWKGVTFTQVQSEGLLLCEVWISEDSHLIHNGIMPTEAEIAMLPVMQNVSFGYQQVKNMKPRLPDVSIPPFTAVFVTQTEWQTLGSSSWARVTTYPFPDGSKNNTQILKDSAKWPIILHQDPITWTTEEYYTEATIWIHETLHQVFNWHYRPWCDVKIIEEGLVELVPKMVLGYQQFMRTSREFLQGLIKDGTTEGDHPNKLHTLREISTDWPGSRYHKRVQANPSYGSAHLFMVGYFLALQEKLIAQCQEPDIPDKQYKDKFVVLNYIIKELSMPETRKAIISNLATMVRRAPEVLYDTYHFQENGQDWVRSLKSAHS